MAALTEAVRQGKTRYVGFSDGRSTDRSGVKMPASSGLCRVSRIFLALAESGK